MIDFECPHCEYPIHAQDSSAGKQGRCKSCHQLITVPAASPVQSSFEDLEETRPIRSTAEPSAAPPPAKPLLGSGGQLALGCALIVFAPIVFCGFLGMVTPKGDSVNRGSGDKTIEAWTAAQILVTERLKSPSTADFGGMSNFQDPRKCVTSLGDGKYEVSGWVDSKNALGATLRTDFTITIKDERDKKQTWIVIGEPMLRTR